MKSYKLLQQLRSDEQDVTNITRKFLESMGWQLTCEVASLWLWTKEIDGKQIYVSASTAMHLAESEVELPYTGEDCHPNGYEDECGCDTCMSYA